jgi:hypothetical protein
MIARFTWRNASRREGQRHRVFGLVDQPTTTISIPACCVASEHAFAIQLSSLGLHCCDSKFAGDAQIGFAVDHQREHKAAFRDSD